MVCCSLYGLLRYGLLHNLQARFPAISPVFLALGASIPGTQTLILTKAMSMMLLISVGGQSQLTHWYFWVTTVTPFVSASVWTAAMQHGLRNYPSIVIFPLLQIMYTVVGVICGVVFFQEYRQMSPAALVMYAIGFLGMFSGIGLSICPDALAAGVQEMKDQAAADTLQTGASESCMLPSNSMTYSTTVPRSCTTVPRCFCPAFSFAGFDFTCVCGHAHTAEV